MCVCVGGGGWCTSSIYPPRPFLTLSQFNPLCGVRSNEQDALSKKCEFLALQVPTYTTKNKFKQKKRKSERTEVLVHILSSLKIEANESIVEPVGAFQKRHVGLPQQAVVVTHENRIHSHLIRLLLPARNVNHNEKNFEFVKWPLVNYTN